jgi:DNA polymerase-4
VTTIGALASLDEAALRQLLPGKVGRLLHQRARGVDPRRLETSVERISISREETFADDVSDRGRLHDELRQMAVEVAGFLMDKQQTARTITSKLRYADFTLRTRSTTLPVGTDEAERIASLACSLLDRALTDRPGALRLVGVGLSGLEAHRQLEIRVTA